jgi:hypothetical protein
LKLQQNEVVLSTLSTPSGENLQLNPSGLYIDCCGHALINTGRSNKNRYEIISPDITTHGSTPRELLNIPMDNMSAAMLVSEVIACSSDGMSVAGFMLSTVAKNTNTVIVSNPVEMNTAKDNALRDANIYYVAGKSSVQLMAVGVNNTDVNWTGVTNVTRQLF